MSRADYDRSRDKQRILDEIRRTAEANGGVPLGRVKFLQETGIRESDWQGKIWIRWGEALLDAGFQPNQLKRAYDDTLLIEKFIGLVRELGHFPVAPEIRMKARRDNDFPSHGTFGRFGSKQQFAAKIREYCSKQDDYEDVVTLCAPVASRPIKESRVEGFAEPQVAGSDGSTKEGYVYMALLQVGRERRYKIGKAILVERRKDQISIQLPENLVLIHTISTDDAYGIEKYWHSRFAAKNTKGEWFALSRPDIDAFKRRKFM
jgi:Meiotically up-regulated gene 113